ncbi:MAG: thioredoxin family protein [Bacillota bacterium]|nr:thioredoxin family protein [Bacillota bacterium]MDP4160979.1 thioredoxin family protein [Bacillota bacterium]
MIKEIYSGKLPSVLNNPTPFVLEFSSEGSPDCQRLHSIVEHIANTLEDKVEIYYVNVDKVPEVRDKYQVENLPTMILFKDGKPHNTMVGYHPEQEVHSFLIQ